MPGSGASAGACGDRTIAAYHTAGGQRRVLAALAFFLLAAGIVQGQNTLTVNDGTATSGYIPMYGLYFDDFTKSECIIPATSLTAMSGGTISAMTFYVSSAATREWANTNQKVFLKEVAGTTLNGSYSGMGGATVVFDGQLPRPDVTGEYTINFSTNYTYGGGNLLIGVYNDDDGTYSGCYWYGVSDLSSGVSAYGYNGTSLGGVDFNAQSFLPKVTFIYTATAPCTPTLTYTTTTYYISRFQTTGATTNINNASSGTGASYSNYYNSVAATASAGATIGFTITIAGGSYITFGSAIWVDWNQNNTFEATERVWNTTSYTGSPHSGSFTIPAGAEGDYRMRVVIDYYGSNPSNPCNASTGEFEDYKLTVLSCSDAYTLSLSSSGGTLATGNTLNIAGILTNTSGITPEYSSSNTGVATVSAAGGVTCVGTGTATITVTIPQTTVGGVTYCSKTVTYTVTGVMNCDQTIILNSNVTQEIACGTTYCFYDSGGSDDPYDDNEDYTAIFTSLGDITLSFVDFYSESASYDYMYIYDGDNVTGTELLNKHGGNSLPSGNPFTATSGTMTVIWHSDGSNKYDGWTATVTAVNCCTTPRTVTISGCPATATTGGSTNLSASVSPTGGGTTVTWESSNPAVATVSSSGVVNYLTPGSTTITASVPRNGVWCKASDECVINVMCSGTEHTIGTASTTGYSYGPVNNFYNYSYRQIIYNPGEVCAGTVNSISFSYAYTSPMTKKSDVEIYIGEVEKTTFADGSDWIDHNLLTRVYSGSMNFTGAGWLGFNFSTPFEYTGQGSLVVAILDNSGSYDGTAYVFNCTNTDGVMRQIYVQRDGSAYDPTAPGSGSYASYRPDTKFCITCCTERTGAAGFRFCRDALNLTVGSSFTFGVEGSDAVTPPGTVVYSSSDPSVATVSADGTVTAVANGSATITATIAAATIEGVKYCKVEDSYTVNVSSSGLVSGCFEIGNGTSTGYYPIPGFYGNQYDVYLYTPAAAPELNESINITSIAYNITTTATNGGQWTIWVKDVAADYTLAAATTFANYTAGAEQVYNNTSISTTNGWNTLNFNAPFAHTGGNALLVAVRGYGCTTSGGCSRQCYYTSATGTQWYKHSDGTDPGTSVSGTVINNRANIKLCYNYTFEPTPLPTVSLSGVPTGTVCAGTPIEITVAAENGTVSFEPALPAGLAYNSSTHKISGTITTNGTYTFTVVVTAADDCLKDTEDVSVQSSKIEAVLEVAP